MKAEELRIGNWVGNIGDPNEYRIAAQNILVEAKANKQGYTRYRPIPLTEEWLLRFGLKFSGYNDEDKAIYKINDEVWIVQNIVTKKYYLDQYVIEIKYVHRLQNLYFALKKEELKTK